jgi:hypothetical protein
VEWQIRHRARIRHPGTEEEEACGVGPVGKSKAWAYMTFSGTKEDL